MTKQELIEKRNRFYASDSISERKHLYDEIESAANIVFNKAARYVPKFGIAFIEQYCYLDYDSTDIDVSDECLLVYNGSDDDVVLFKLNLDWFDYSDSDWEEKFKGKQAEWRIGILQRRIKNAEETIKLSMEGIEKMNSEIEKIKREGFDVDAFLTR